MSERKAPTNPIILIPARMSSTRLPGKPLEDIAGVPMVVQVLKRGLECNLGPVAVACDHEDVFNAVMNAGGTAIMTNPDHPSGSDRIFEALETLDPDKKYDSVINLQGDLPTIDPATILKAFEMLSDPAVDIGTLGVEITDEMEKHNPSVVKAIVELDEAHSRGRALYFTRAVAPTGEGPFLHHIGIYTYRRDALEKFVKLSPSYLEMREKLEQLRALAHDMRIDLGVVDTNPLGVDTIEDLEQARLILGNPT